MTKQLRRHAQDGLTVAEEAVKALQSLHEARVREYDGLVEVCDVLLSQRPLTAEEVLAIQQLADHLRQGRADAGTMTTLVVQYANRIDEMRATLRRV